MNAEKRDHLATILISSGAIFAGILFILFLLYLIVEGLPQLSWHFLTTASDSFSTNGGIRDQLFNSFYLVVITLIISIPLSLGAAIYLSEYAKDNVFTRALRLAIEVLSSLPSVVIGLFGYLIFVVNFKMGFSILAGALALTILNIPLLTTNAEQALRQIPYLQRQAGLGLGMTKWRVTKDIVIPAAFPSILTGVILASGRIFGEAAALIFTSGQSSIAVSYSNWNPFDPTSFLNLMRPAETLAVNIWKLNTEGLVPNAQAISSGAVAVLILTILIFNICARLFSAYISKKLGK
ncbi:phosphate ABC transporter permease PstA [Lactobacillus jensenii]|uniref:phosphate ABC transporter permease PstA n=1 Tax=Lactobacillus jensenii TaxID=109790 RepID=UPI001F09FE4E|nr:phosphate ABC transporter permease PstA [Lactobacillus jensenii]